MTIRQSLGRSGSPVTILAALTMSPKTKVEIDIDIMPDMLAAGLQVLVDSGVLDRGAGCELPTGADKALVTDISTKR
jgi:hypothetical protein